MSVSAISSSAGAAGPVPTDVERTIAVMRKAKDAQTAQAEGLVALIQQAGDIGRNLNVYA